MPQWHHSTQSSQTFTESTNVRSPMLFAGKQ